MLRKKRLKDILSPLHQVFIYGTAVLLQLCQFWDIIQSELAHKSPYTPSIRGMRMRFPELQDNNKKVKNLWSDNVDIMYYNYISR